MPDRLRLIREEMRPSDPRGGRSGTLALGLVLLAVAALSTLLGADAARRPVGAQQLAEEAVETALERGSADPTVRARLVTLRRVLSSRPLDSRTRVTYAGLLLGLGRNLDDLQAAVFHAGRAAELSPVTVPVVRHASVVLARGRESARALALAREMFDYDERSAADLLSRLEPLVPAQELELGLADSPGAWLAWSRRLRRDDRTAEADEWLERTGLRWPDHLPTLRRRAAHAAQRADMEALARLFPDGLELPSVREAAAPLAYRALLRAARGDAAGSRDDVARSLVLDGENPAVLMLTGEARQAAGEMDDARRDWQRALFALPPGDSGARRSLLVRLARLEDRSGEPAAALRRWRAVLEIEPQHGEALRRADDLSGGRR